MQGVRIGELLVERGILTARRVEHLLSIQQRVRRPLGVLATEFYGVDPKCIEEAWVQQYIRLTGIVDLAQHPIDSRCLKLVPAKQAYAYHVLPMCRVGDDLHVATSATHFSSAMQFVADQMKDPTLLSVAQDEQLEHFIRCCYPDPQCNDAAADEAAVTPEASGAWAPQ